MAYSGNKKIPFWELTFAIADKCSDKSDFERVFSDFENLAKIVFNYRTDIDLDRLDFDSLESYFQGVSKIGFEQYIKRLNKRTSPSFWRVKELADKVYKEINLNK